MRKNDLSEIKKMDIKSLGEKAKKLRLELANLVIDKSVNKLANLKLVKTKKKGLAQVLTVLRQKQLILELERKNNG